MKKTYPRHVRKLIPLLIALAFSPGVFAQATALGDRTKLLDNSTASPDGSAYSLNAGDWLIDADANGGTLDIIDSTPDSLVIDDAGTTLTVNGGSAKNTAGFKARRFVQNDGTINTKGGSGKGKDFNHGIDINAFTQNGGTINATGGDGGRAHGINANDSFMQNNGTINATGGSGADDSYGIYAGSFTQNGGTINAKGGIKGNYGDDDDWNFGIRALSFAQNGGTLNADGGSLNLASGIGIDDFTQTGGTINATGGIGKQAYGIGTDSFTQNGGTVTAIGGSGELAHGIHSDHFMQNDGVINAAGGSGNTAVGIDTDSFTQTGGTINAKGGSGPVADGIRVTGTFVQDNGAIIATGSDSSTVYGIYVRQGSLIQNNGTITAMGGSGRDARGIDVEVDFTQNGGTVIAAGGSGYDSKGIVVSNDFTQNGGTITAVGGSGASGSYGIKAKSLTQNGGTTTATGGGGKNAHGIVVHGNIEQNDGAIIAMGGEGLEAHGINVASTAGNTFTFTQSGGTLTAIGGGGFAAYGFNVSTTAGDAFTQADGTITAKGGSGEQALGISAYDFTQSGGTLSATGGEGGGAAGMRISGAAEQSGGMFSATGGIGDRAYGIRVANTFTQSGGVLAADRQGEAASLIVANISGSATALTFSGITTYAPTIDPNGNGGLVYVLSGDVRIESGASLAPVLRGGSALGAGHSASGTATVLETETGVIDGSFIVAQPASPTLSFTANNNGDNYTVDWNYTSPSRLLGSSRLSANNMRFLGALATVQTDGVSQAQIDALSAMYDPIVNAGSLGEMSALALSATRASMPLGTMRLASFSRHQLDAVERVFDGNVRSLAAARRQEGLAWATPVYQSGDHDAATNEFSDADEDFGGITIGAARTMGDATFGVQAHYLDGRLKSGGSDPYHKADADTYGITLGARFDKLLPTYDTGKNSTWVRTTLGYSRESLEQKRADFVGTTHKSSPDADLWRIGASVGRDIVAGSVTLSPELGLDYTRVSLDGYREKTNNGYALSVDADDFESLRVKLGARMEVSLQEKLTFTGGAFWRHEFKDRNMQLDTSFLGASATVFATQGEKLDRDSGQFDLGLRYQATDKVSFTAGYSLVLDDNYTGNQFGLNFNMKF